MRYYLLPLLLTFSMAANAIPVQWTTDGQGCELNGTNLIGCLHGSFFFDSDAGTYSNIDLTFDWYFPPGYVSVDAFVEGDQTYLDTWDSLYSPNFGLSLRNYDLTHLVAQEYQWGVSVKYLGFLGYSNATLTPHYEPPVVSIPATLPLLGVGLAALGCSRRRRLQLLHH
jgi:hypothetical protein